MYSATSTLSGIAVPASPIRWRPNKGVQRTGLRPGSNSRSVVTYGHAAGSESEKGREGGGEGRGGWDGGVGRRQRRVLHEAEAGEDGPRKLGTRGRVGTWACAGTYVDSRTILKDSGVEVRASTGAEPSASRLEGEQKSGQDNESEVNLTYYIKY
ncbi:hypothetical protein C8F04DRAFT_1186087 [Mycena alexandri]|uniref:Uncharacterized protein n=1 Tax=Mycena alexandri TaxID=1745969 RepID=A0AAD6SQG3_9AGAR|nr:hypothetical protein C8F04DRAFT_1186087 [Mycena alexandri]